MDKSLIKKGIKYGTKSRDSGLMIPRGTASNKVTLAPKDGDVLETVQLFQQKYNKTNNHGGGDHLDGDEERKRGQSENQQCCLPSGWGKRVKKPGPVRTYNRQEIMEYNEVQYTQGKVSAKSWADRRWYERDNT